MWTAPIGKRFFAVTNDLVCIGHMSGLLVRHMTAGPDDFRLPRSPIIAASFEARDVWRGVLGFRWRPCRSSLLSCLPYVDGPYWQALFCSYERFGLHRSYVRPFGAAHD